MTKLLAIAILLSVGAANAETTLPAPDPAPALDRPMVRNIGIAEQGDAIVVRERRPAPEPVPTTKPAQK
jgi:hypothetical protein